ncbi:hypothetical protein C8R42DRAFT_666205, partial [Lentinula raphanica]
MLLILSSCVWRCYWMLRRRTRTFDAEQAKSKVHPDVKKQRSRDKMQRYPCGGWLNITMRDGHPEEARIRLTHKSHPEY